MRGYASDTCTLSCAQVSFRIAQLLQQNRLRGAVPDAPAALVGAEDGSRGGDAVASAAVPPAAAAPLRSPAPSPVAAAVDASGAGTSGTATGQ